MILKGYKKLSFFASIDNHNSEKNSIVTNMVQKRGLYSYGTKLLLEQICKKRQCAGLFILQRNTKKTKTKSERKQKTTDRRNVGAILAIDTIRGIVLKEMPKGETSKQVIVLAKGLGKIWMTAKGARKQKSKLLAGTQMFCYCDFQAYESRGFYTISQADVIESFFDLRLDMDRLASAIYAADFAERIALRGMEQDSMLLLLLKTFQILSKKGYSPLLASRIFELKLIQIAGIMPNMTEKCSVCGKRASAYFSGAAGGMVCMEHRSGSKKIADGTKNAMRFVFSQPLSNAFQFSVSSEVLKELDEILEQYIQIHMNLKLGTRDFEKKYKQLL